MRFLHLAVGDNQPAHGRPVCNARRVRSRRIPRRLRCIDDVNQRGRSLIDGHPRGWLDERYLHNLAQVHVAAAVGNEEVHHRWIVSGIGAGGKNHALRVDQPHLREIVFHEQAAVGRQFAESRSGGIADIKMTICGVIGQTAYRRACRHIQPDPLDMAMPCRQRAEHVRQIGLHRHQVRPGGIQHKQAVARLVDGYALRVCQAQPGGIEPVDRLIRRGS